MGFLLKPALSPSRRLSSSFCPPPVFRTKRLPCDTPPHRGKTLCFNIPGAFQALVSKFFPPAPPIHVSDAAYGFIDKVSKAPAEAFHPLFTAAAAVEVSVKKTGEKASCELTTAFVSASLGKHVLSLLNNWIFYAAVLVGIYISVAGTVGWRWSKGKTEAETKPKTEAEKKAKTEAEMKAKTEADTKGKSEAETKEKTEAEKETKTLPVKEVK